ncbi:10 kDa chaperonin, mitochondrial [Selaginella moellendorffii]|nr:10 kDa chaperonin, mitochondrial [Selaginella moellendorffii]|eukprot:XP_002965697.2 10 kDa chaperonin, mitochondrial [Selaginella moellendorffii]
MASIASRFTPLLDRVLVEKLVPPAKSVGGVLLPETQKHINGGTVVAVGQGVYNSDGEIVPNLCKVGDKVLLPDWGGVEIKLEDKSYEVFRDKSILAIMSDFE